MRKFRSSIIFLVVIVAAAAGGWFAASQIKSPAQIAAEAEPPEPSLITVPVERMTIANDVVTRGTVRFEEPESISVSGVSLDGVAPVVTSVPEVGDQFSEGDVLYEVAGRPAILLAGDLPLFRTVRLGDEGEDVLQLQDALARLGFEITEFDGVYGTETEAAVVALYESLGYDPVEPSELAEEAYGAARDAYNAARDASSDASTALSAAKAAESDAIDARVVAEDRLAQAEAGTHPDTGLPPTPEELAALEADVVQATQAVAEASASVNVANSAARDANRSRSSASAALSRARSELAHPAPETEFLFFDAFPLRVDFVAVERGDLAQGEIMSVSGARLAIDSAVKESEAEYVQVGTEVTIELDSEGILLTGTVTQVANTTGTNDVAADRVYVEIVPEEVRTELNNTNVKITIPIESRSTSGEVMAVPAAALSATGSGETIVTVEDDDGSTRAVAVETGLSTAGGMVEITPVSGGLEVGDRVVVGFQAGSG